MRIRLGVIMFLILTVFLFGGVSYGMMCHGGSHDEHSGKDKMTHSGHTQKAMTMGSKASVNIGNKICPVTGEKITAKKHLTVEHKGKIYNLCCEGCIGEFNKNPGKYISKFKEIKVTAEQFKFTPEIITVNKGDIVRIELTSRDVSHGLYIEGYNVDIAVKANGKKSLEFLADKPGKYEYKCSVYCGPKHSKMKGTLIVK